ncbi:MAG: 50S ribosomal protein L23 [Gemmatimonadales bacterium]
MADLHKVVVRPVVTEKSSASYASRQEYTFIARPDATKNEIKDAIEQLFGVRVKKVRTLIQRSKRKTMGKYVGRRPKWKKAFVQLEGDDTIEVFEG